MLPFLYRCASDGSVNNGLKQFCDFEQKMQEGTHHCPLCGNPLVRVSDGPSVSEILRRGSKTEALSSPVIRPIKNDKKEDT